MKGTKRDGSQGCGINEVFSFCCNIIAKYIGFEESVEKSTDISEGKVESALLATWFHAGFIFGLFFDHEDGGDSFLRNVS
jgi:hypothetical protein